MLLNFNMETKMINELINIQAHDHINDIQFLEREIRKFLASPKRKMMIDGDLYYDYEQNILNKKRTVIDQDGKMLEDPQLPNNRWMDNQYQKMVNQKVNYILSKPLTFQSDNQQYVDALRNIFGKKMHRLLKNLGKDIYNGGIGWLYPHFDPNGEFKIKKFHPWEILPFWKDEDHTELDFAVRIYQMEWYEGGVEKVFTHVEVYDTNGIHQFEYNNGSLTPNYSTYYFDYPDAEVGSAVGYNWTRVPLIPFKANNTETPLIKKCKSLQDGINQILSDFGDGMQENCSGSSVLVIKNYDGQDLGQLRHNLNTYKAVKVRTVDGSDGGIDKLEITVNAENYKAVLQELRKSLIKNCSGYDIDELKSSGSPNEMTIKSVYSDIDLDANELETEFQAGFEDLLWFINQYFATVGIGNFEGEQIDVILNRDMMVNESAVILDIKNSVGILSNETLVAQHPWIDDPDEEIKRLDAQKQEAIDEYQTAFRQTANDPEQDPEGDDQ